VWKLRQRDLRGSGRGRRPGTVDESRDDGAACRTDEPAGIRGHRLDESPGSCHDGRDQEAIRPGDDGTPRGSLPSRPTTTDARVRVDAPLAERMPGPPVVPRDADDPGRHLRMADRFRCAPEVDFASTTVSRAGTGRRPDRQQWRLDRTMVTKRATATRHGRSPAGVARKSTGPSGRDEDRTKDVGGVSKRGPELLAPERIGQTSRSLVTPDGRGSLADPIHHPVYASINPAGQRQEGLARREARPASWEGKPLKGKTPEALPTRNKVGRASGGATRQEAEKACRRCTAG
jgi:hypothetical protein